MLLTQKINVNDYKKEDFEKNLDKETGYKPNKWQTIIRETQSRFKTLCIGRRGGKSLYVVYDSRDGLVSDLVLPMQRVWVVAPNYDLTQRVWDELVHLATSKFSSVIHRIHNNKGNFKIETVLGTTIEAKSADTPETLVGTGLTKIIIDEAAQVKQKAWTQSLRPTLIDHKGKAIFISTPKGKNWFWELYQRGLGNNNEYRSFHFTTYDNEYLDRKEIESLVQDMPDYEYRQEILAEFEETSEQLFRKFREPIKIWEEKYGNPKNSEVLVEPKKGHRYQIGVDLGRKTSYSVIVVIDEMEYPSPVVYFDRFKAIDWNLQKLRIKKVWDMYPCLRLCNDATGIGDPMDENLMNIGVRTDPFIYKETSKKQLIDKLSIAIEEGRICYPNLPILINEIETFGREISKDTGRVKYHAMGKHGDDCVNSLALANWGLIDRPRKIVFKEEGDKKNKYKPISKITGY